MWREIANSYIHQVSTKGEIKSTDKFINHRRGGKRMFKGKIKKQILDKRSGYMRVSVIINGKQVGYYVHRLVAQAFIPNPENKPEVNHKDGNKHNNCVENLERVTSKENQLHRFRELGHIGHWKGKFGKDHNISRGVIQYSRDGELIREWGSISDINRELGYNVGNISQCCRLNKNYSHAFGFVWRYKIDYINNKDLLTKL